MKPATVYTVSMYFLIPELSDGDGGCLARIAHRNTGKAAHQACPD
jgi:hypothetical protein